VAAVSIVPADRLPEDAEALALRREGRAVLDAYRAFLQHPAFVHRVDLAVLTKLATDEATPQRVRARAAEVLGNFFHRAAEAYAALLGVREANLEAQGIDSSAKAAAVAQVVTKIEIVRDRDWRDASVEARVERGE
jgi:hypothetical protein